MQEVDLKTCTPKKVCPTVSETSSSPVGNPSQMNLHVAKKKADINNTVVLSRSHMRMMSQKATKSCKTPDNIVKGANFIAGPYTLRRPIPQSDVRLINYVHMGGRETTEDENK